ncbi:MAG: LysE/ArgO family amino acid transporter [Rhodocyclaceae bacterium]
MWAAWMKGFGLGAGLIIAIGAQNAHVLRMGLARRHVGVTVLVCVVGDVLLISAGVAGIGALIGQHAGLMALARWAGAAFLCWYGLRAWAAARAGEQLTLAQGPRHLGLRQATLAALAFTWLNPHVYLDTVVLLGSVASQQTTAARPWFAGGAITASLLWFASLGYGARLLSPWFATPTAWRALDAAIGAIMFALAASLVLM